MNSLIQKTIGSLALLTTLLTLTPKAGHAAEFTAGNIVVYRVGTGSGALASSATAAFLDEYTTSGTYVQTITLPTTVASSGNRAMTCSGTATSEGQITLSTDGSYISCVGYNAAPGTTAIANTSNNGGGSDVARVIGRVDVSGNIDSSTALIGSAGTPLYSGNNIRDAVISGASIYSCGASAPSIGYSTLGGNTAASVLASGTIRIVHVFGGDLYYTTSGTLQKFTGLPTSTATPISLLSGLTTASGFVFLDVGSSGSINTCYLVDGTSLRKYSVSGTTLTANGTATVTGSISGLAAKVSGSTVTLYVSSPAKIETITDSAGSSGTLSGTATALTLVNNPVSANFAFRGIAFAPVSSVAIDNSGTPASGSINTGANDVPVFGFQLTPTGGSVDFAALKLTTSGTATSSDLSNFRVVYDADNSGTYNGGDSVVSGSGASLANPINFVISGQTGFSTARRYLVIANVAGGATAGHTFTGSIAAATDVTTTIPASGTAAGNQQTIASAAFDLTMAAVASSESATISSLVNDATITSTSQGAQVWRVTFANPAGSAGACTISAITFTQGTNNQVANWQNTIQAAELFDGTTALAAGTISATSIAFSGLSVGVADGGSRTLNLRISLKSTAGALTDNTGFQFALAAGNVTVSGNGVTTASISSDQSQNLISVVATRLVFTSVPTYVVINTVFSATVQAQDANGNRDLDDTTYVTITLASGAGGLTGGAGFSLTAGICTWNALLYDTLGVFTLSASGSPLPSATSATITARLAPTLTEVFLPQYIQGIASGSSNSKRLPFAYCLTLSNLTANATYRYYNQCVISTDTATSTGAGNVILVASSGSFVRTTSPGLSSAGGYGTFTTDANGTYTGWFVTETTGNARFATAGNQVFMRIILNDGAGGTAVTTRLTTPDSAAVLPFGTDATTGTGIRGNSSASDKNFVLLYDNVAGSGRPLAATFVESDGVAENTAVSYVQFYNDSVDGTSGAWGTIIPNSNANGVQRIEQRKLSDASLVAANTASSGVWPSSANTVNPSGGDATAIVITASDAPLAGSSPTTPAITAIHVVGTDVLIDFTGGASDAITDFTVLRSADLRTPLTPIAAKITTSEPGQFRASVPVGTPQAFYRIKR